MGVKFNKMLFIGINEASLNKEYWQRLNKLAGKRVFLPKDSPDILKQIQDTDCLLVGFGVSVDVGMMDAAPQLKYIGALQQHMVKSIQITLSSRQSLFVISPGIALKLLLNLFLQLFLSI